MNRQILPALYHLGLLPADLRFRYATAVDITMGDSYPDLAAQLRANISRFAAYKAASATADIRQDTADYGIDEGIASLHRHRRWLAAEYNPATTGKIFSDKASYFANTNENFHKKIRTDYRNITRNQFDSYNQTVKSTIGPIHKDKICIYECTKGSHSTETLFLKTELATHIEQFTHLLTNRRIEKIVLNHNNPSSEFYQRKKSFYYMVVYDLTFDGYTYTVKLGKMKGSGFLSLYCITG